MNIPLVTVLMPVYNAEKYVAQTIESILKQTYTDFEFLIIDDGSTDKSLEIIQSFHDSRIRVVRNEQNIKLIATLNKGIELASGKYICRADADDVNEYNRIEKQVEFMGQNPEYAACGSWVRIFYEDSNLAFVYKLTEKHDDIRIKTLYQNHFCHPASFIRKDFINQHNLRFDPMFIHSEDYCFFVRLSEIGKLYNIQENLINIRKHSTNVSVLNADEQNRNSLLVIKFQLERMGIQPESINYDIYFRFFYATFDMQPKEIELTEKMICDFIDANNKSNYLPKDKFNKFMSDKWFHLCMNSTRYGLWVYNKFCTSPLNKYYNITTFDRFKLQIKSRIKYKKN